MTATRQGYVAELTRNWSLLAGTFVIAGVAVHALPFYTAGLFIPELEKAFGWSRAMASGSSLAVSLGVAIGAPLTGRALDRFGTRRCALFSLGVLVLGYVSLATMDGAYWRFVLTWALMGSLGLGSSALAMTRLIGTWFSSARGFALGITLSGSGVLAMFAPAMISAAIEAWGWRGGYLATGAIMLAAAPMALLFKEGPLLKQEQATAAAPTWAFFRTPRYWLIATAILSLVTASTGLAVHLVPILRGLGADPMRAAEMAGVMGMAVMLGRLVAGFLLDRIHAALIGIGIALMASIACGLFAITGLQGALPAAFLLGFLLGSDFDLMSYMVARYFGLQLYGRIYGTLFAAASVLTGLSPLVTGAIFDHTHSYDLAIGLAAAMFLVAIPLFWLIDPAAARAIKLQKTEP